MVKGKHNTSGSRTRHSSGSHRSRGRRSRRRLVAIATAGIGLVFGACSVFFIVSQVNAAKVGSELTQWSVQGHAPDGGVWDEYWVLANDSATTKFRSSGAQEHLALLSEWRAHQVRLDVDARAKWYHAATEHYRRSLEARPLSAVLWGQFAYSGLGSMSRAERVQAVDRALVLGHGRDQVQESALMTLLADAELDADRLAERVGMIAEQRGSRDPAIVLLERAAESVSSNDPRVAIVRDLISGNRASTVVDGGDG